MSNQPIVNGKELKRLDCGHAESSRCIDWEGFASLGVGDYFTPYHCAECGLKVPDPAHPWTLGQSLATALAGAVFIVLLAVLGVVPYILFGFWLMLAIAFLYMSGTVLVAVVSLIVRVFHLSAPGGGTRPPHRWLGSRARLPGIERVRSGRPKHGILDYLSR